MAVPKKRTSKAKKNKRKTVWKQKAIPVLIRNQGLDLVLEEEKKKEKSLVFSGFRAELRFKHQFADQLRSKKKHFLEDSVKDQLEAESKKRQAFKPESEKQFDQEIDARWVYNKEIQKQKEIRVVARKNAKLLQRNKELTPEQLYEELEKKKKKKQKKKQKDSIIDD